MSAMLKVGPEKREIVYTNVRNFDGWAQYPLAYGRIALPGRTKFLREIPFQKRDHFWMVSHKNIPLDGAAA